MRFYAIAGAIALATTGLGQSFVNGGFESGNFTGWTITNTSNGTTATQVVESFDIDGPGALNASLAAKFSVGQAVAGGGNQGIELTQMLNLTNGVTYTISFNWAAIRTIAGANAQGGIFDLIVNGTSIGQASAGSTGSATPHYGLLSQTYTAATTGAHSIGVRITRPFTIPTPTAPTLFQYVDNFNIVPEPATMTCLALGVVALVRRRRR